MGRETGKSTENISSWRAVFDDNAQKCYYYNDTTGESTWEKPIGAGAAAITATAVNTTPTTTDKTPVTNNEGSNSFRTTTNGGRKSTKSGFGFGRSLSSRKALKKRSIAFFGSSGEGGGGGDDDRDCIDGEDGGKRRSEEEERAIRIQKQRAHGLALKQERIERQRLVKEAALRMEAAAREAREKLLGEKTACPGSKTLRTGKSTPAVAELSERQKQSNSSHKKSICWLCRRSFKSDTMLRRHESESALHKKNLAALEEKKTKYVDRAAKRRELHGVPSHRATFDTSRLSQKRGFDQGNSNARGEPQLGHEKMKRRRSSYGPKGGPSVGTTSRASLQKPIGKNNVGRRMLESMGWIEGKGLGKRESGITNPVDHAEMGGGRRIAAKGRAWRE
eukprot:g5421.t1